MAIIAADGFKISKTNTPTREGERIATIADITNREKVPNPSVGMLIFVEDEQAYYTVLELGSDKIGGIEVPNVVVSKYKKVEVEDGSISKKKLSSEVQKELKTLNEDIAQAKIVADKAAADIGVDGITLLQGGINSDGNANVSIYYLRTARFSTFKLVVNDGYTIGQLAQYDLGGNFVALYSDYTQPLVGVEWTPTSVVATDKEYMWVAVVFKGNSPTTAISPREAVVKIFVSGLHYYMQGGESDPQSAAQQAKAIIDNTIEQLPNEDDLTFSNEGKMQLANRSVEIKDDKVSSLGYVVLRKNKSFAEQVNKENCIYEIRYEFDLNGEEVEIPANCTLKFSGGKLSNGVINGVFQVSADNVIIFDTTLKIEGTLINNEVHATWYGITPNSEDNSDALSKIVSDTQTGGMTTILFDSGKYLFKKEVGLNGVILKGKYPIIPMDYKIRDNAEFLTEFIFSPDDKGTYIDVVESTSEEDISTEKKSIFLKSIPAVLNGEILANSSGFNLENIYLSSTKEDGKNTIAIESRSFLNSRNCRIRGFNTAIRKYHGQYSHIDNTDITNCDIAIYYPHDSSDVDTTIYIDGCSISLCKYVVKTCPILDFTRVQNATDVSFNNCVIQGCETFILHWDRCITTLQLVNTYFEANTNKDNYLIKYLASQNFAKDSIQLKPTISIVNSFYNSGTNFMFAEIGNINIFRGVYSMNPTNNIVLAVDASKIPNHPLCINIDSITENNAKVFHSISELSWLMRRNVRISSSKMRANLSEGMATVYSRLKIGDPSDSSYDTTIEAANVRDQKVVTFGSADMNPSLKTVNFGGSSTIDYGVTGLPGLKKGIGLQVTEKSDYEEEKISDETSHYSGAVFKAFRDKDSTNDYLGRAFVEVVSEGLKNVQVKNLKRNVLKTANYSDISYNNAEFKTAAGDTRFKGYDWLKYNNSKGCESVHYANGVLFKNILHPIEVDIISDKTPTDANLPVGFVHINSTSNQLEVVTAKGDRNVKSVQFATTTPITGTLTLTIGDDEYSVTLLNSTSDDIVKAFCRLNGDDVKYRFYAEGTALYISVDVNDSTLLTALRGVSSSSFSVLDGLTTTVVTARNYKAPVWEKFNLAKTGITSERPTGVSTGFQFFDATLSKPIWWSGSKWVDSTGTEV